MHPVLQRSGSSGSWKTISSLNGDLKSLAHLPFEWFTELVLKGQWIDDILFSCMYFLDYPPEEVHSSAETNPQASVILCQFYIPKPMGSEGWRFLKEKTQEGRCWWWQKADYIHFETISIVESNLNFDTICSAVQFCKQKSLKNSGSLEVSRLCKDIREKMKEKTSIF